MPELRAMNDKVNVLLVDDQPAKLLANEEILRDLGENLIKAASAREALEFLLKNEAAVVLIDVCMPELDGFQLAAMIRDHPRFQKTAIIFISAVQVEDVDRVRGYQMGAVDYVPVPVVPAVLRAKVKIFAELYRKTRQLERLNAELERRVTERTAELQASTMRLVQSEQGRSLALAAGQMGSWDFDPVTGECKWDEGQHHIFGVERGRFQVTVDSIRAMIHPEDWERLLARGRRMAQGERTVQADFRVVQPGGSVRWCTGTAAASFDAANRLVRVSGVTIDVTERKEAEQRQDLLAREVDHRARNALAVVQSIVRLTRASSVGDYVAAVEGRIKALARAHALLSDSRWHSADLGALVAEELAPYRTGEVDKVEVIGPNVSLPPHMAQGLALALHELATNAAKHGALSSMLGKVSLNWQLRPDLLVLKWVETGGPLIAPPSARSFGLKVIRASIENQLRGKATFDWAPQGMQCMLVDSAARNRSRARAKEGGQRRGSRRQTNGRGGGPANLAGRGRSARRHDDCRMPDGKRTQRHRPDCRRRPTRCRPPRTTTTTPPSSTSISATAWPIRSPTSCRRAAFRLSLSPATTPTPSTSASAPCRSCRSRLSGKCWSGCFCRARASRRLRAAAAPAAASRRRG